ncbi:MAG: hypothetical protein IJR82_03755 [Bacilli bacterium]|nr:hypothetical protein [Bacilli bacterium]
MQVSTELRPMFSFPSHCIIIIVGVVVLLTIIYLFLNRKKRSPKAIIPQKKDIVLIKQHYLNDINELEQKCKSRQISNRETYQKLSLLIRLFIFEMTSIKVQNYTLSEIEKINIPILSELVREYYNPEFASISNGDVMISIKKTREVIIRWN